MVFGDGDGVLFSDFTASLDVIAHELTHGVTEFTAGLEYHKQAGALNESMSDIVGSLVKQWANRHTAAQADWLIGADIFTPRIAADALRSLKAPGTAYDNRDMGPDPQPAHMDKYMKLPDSEDGDWGGVHINSGIPNHAFYLTAIGVGGNAWEAPGHVWYEALRASSARTDFQQFADNTYIKAGQLYGNASTIQKALIDGWQKVGIRITGSLLAGSDAGDSANRAKSDGDLTKRIDALTAKIDKLSQDIAALKKR
jgi:Zn-dependent metalloprotease